MVLEGILKVAPDTELGIEKMRKMTLAFMAAMMLLTISACKQDVYGELFVPREAVTFQVTTENGQALPDVSLMTEELDDFDYDLILNGTHYYSTDAEGKVTVDDAPYYTTERLTKRTTRFTFTATDYVDFDTIFNYWDGTVDIVLHRE